MPQPTKSASCARCGSSALEPAWLQPEAKVSLRLQNAPFQRLGTANVPVEVHLCLDCGAIELRGDVEKARRVLGKGTSSG